LDIAKGIRREGRVDNETERRSFCQYHLMTEGSVEDLKAAVKNLTETQVHMRETLMQLSEVFRAVERLEKRMDRLEIQRDGIVEKCERKGEERNREQDEKLDEVRAFMYKAIGVGALAVPLLTIAAQVLMAKML
jgi:hypothetical protein